jgi:hypothetical protein
MFPRLSLAQRNAKTVILPKEKLMRLRGRAEEVSERAELDEALSVAYEELRRLVAGVAI